MQYKGVEYELTPVERGLWKWRFSVGDVAKVGRTKPNLKLLADRKVRMAIDRALRDSTNAQQSE